MAIEIPKIKLKIEEPEQEPRFEEFDQKMIKIGRGARKGIDLALEDKKVSRVHAVIQSGKKGTFYLMGMGGSGILIDGKKIGARGKLANDSEILLGQTKITVTLEEEKAPAEVVSESVSEHSGADAERPVVSVGEVTGEGTPASSPAFSSEQGNVAATGEQAVFASLKALSPGQASNEENVYPSHTTPSNSYGFWTTPPPPLPEKMGEPSLELLLNVVDRIGKESWFEKSSE